MNGYWLNFGCGGNLLPAPWRNFDIDRPNPGDRIDITKSLPFADESAEYVFAEHVVEHVSPAEAWAFFKECRRILMRGGVLRIAVPSIVRVMEEADDRYFEWLGKSGFGRPTIESAVENLTVNHGHRALWSEELLICCFTALHFYPCTCHRPGVSNVKALCGLEGHGAMIGEWNNRVETIIVEAVR